MCSIWILNVPANLEPNDPVYFILSIMLFKKLDINIFNNFSSSENINLDWLRKQNEIFTHYPDQNIEYVTEPKMKYASVVLKEADAHEYVN